MASTIQQLITNLEETIVYLKTQLPKEDAKPVKADKKKKEDAEVKEPVEKKVAAKKEPAEKKVAAKKDPVEKKETEKKVVAKKAEPKEKNLNRMTPAIKTELTKVLKTRDVELTEELRKEFIEYVNGMETDAYAASNLTAHMEAFAKSKAGVEEEEEEEVVEDEAPVKKTVKSEYAGQQDPPQLTGRSNAAPPLNLHAIMRTVSTETLNTLKKTETLKPLGDGNYWYAKDGVYVFEDTDEDMEEFEHNGDTHVYSVSSKRVYMTTDDKDVFVGFLGVGEFKDVKV